MWKSRGYYEEPETGRHWNNIVQSAKPTGQGPIIWYTPGWDLSLLEVESYNAVVVPTWWPCFILMVPGSNRTPVSAHLAVLNKCPSIKFMDSDGEVRTRRSRELELFENPQITNQKQTTCIFNLEYVFLRLSNLYWGNKPSESHFLIDFYTTRGVEFLPTGFQVYKWQHTETPRLLSALLTCITNLVHFLPWVTLKYHYHEVHICSVLYRKGHQTGNVSFPSKSTLFIAKLLTNCNKLVSLANSCSPQI